MLKMIGAVWSWQSFMGFQLNGLGGGKSASVVAQLHGVAQVDGRAHGASAGALGSGGADGVGGGHHPGGLGKLDSYRVDVDPDYVLLQLLQGLSPSTNRLSG